MLLLNTADYALVKARERDEGSRLEVINALLMCGLALEATPNHVGSHVFPGDDGDAVWSVIERTNPRRKLGAIAEAVGLRIDFGIEPFQHFAAIFTFRKTNAHGKTVTLTGQASHADLMSMPLRHIEPFQTEWERYCTVETAQAWLDAVSKMARMLCEAADCSTPGDTATWGA